MRLSICADSGHQPGKLVAGHFSLGSNCSVKQTCQWHVCSVSRSAMLTGATFPAGPRFSCYAFCWASKKKWGWPFSVGDVGSHSVVTVEETCAPHPSRLRRATFPPRGRLSVHSRDLADICRVSGGGRKPHSRWSQAPPTRSTVAGTVLMHLCGRDSCDLRRC